MLIMWITTNTLYVLIQVIKIRSVIQKDKVGEFHLKWELKLNIDKASWTIETS